MITDFPTLLQWQLRVSEHQRGVWFLYAYRDDLSEASKLCGPNEVCCE